jgi:hypothetical protein
MRERDEMEFHRNLKVVEGTYEAKANWGKITVTLEAIPNYAGGKGRPDELLAIEVKFAILGTDIKLSIPVLIELGKTGFSDAMVDLNEFCERSMSGEQKSHIEIPMIVVGGDSYKKMGPQERQLIARFNLTQVPKRMVK